MKAYIDVQTNTRDLSTIWATPSNLGKLQLFLRYSSPSDFLLFSVGFLYLFTSCFTNFKIKSYHDCFFLEMACSSCGIVVVSPSCNLYSFPCPDLESVPLSASSSDSTASSLHHPFTFAIYQFDSYSSHVLLAFVSYYAH